MVKLASAFLFGEFTIEFDSNLKHVGSILDCPTNNPLFEVYKDQDNLIFVKLKDEKEYSLICDSVEYGISKRLLNRCLETHNLSKGQVLSDRKCFDATVHISLIPTQTRNKRSITSSDKMKIETNGKTFEFEPENLENIKFDGGNCLAGETLDVISGVVDFLKKSTTKENQSFFSKKLFKI
jgi:hypothetical protein